MNNENFQNNVEITVLNLEKNRVKWKQMYNMYNVHATLKMINNKRTKNYYIFSNYFINVSRSRYITK